MGAESLKELPETTTLPAPEVIKGDPVEWARSAQLRLGDDYRKVGEVLRELDSLVSSFLSRPRCHVHRAGANQSGVPSGTWTKVVFTAEWYDDGNAFDTATSRWTPGRLGRAHISARVGWSAMSDASLVGVAIYRNGSEVVAALTGTSGTFGDGDQGAMISVDVEVSTVADYFEIFARQDSGVTREIFGAPSRTWLSAHLL